MADNPLSPSSVLGQNANGDAEVIKSTGNALWVTETGGAGAVVGPGAGATAQRVVVAGYVFDVSVTPTVTNGGYSAGDIMGALMTFAVAQVADEGVILDAVQVAFKAAVVPSLTLVIFNADPTATTKTDNAVYSLNAADAFKVRGAVPVNSLGGFMVDHGTPNTFHIGNLSLPIKPATGTVNIFVLLIDNTGVTLTSTLDVQVTLQGRGA